MAGPRISIVNGRDLEICCGEEDDSCITIPGHSGSGGGGSSGGPEPKKPSGTAESTPQPPVIWPIGMMERLGAAGLPRRFLEDILSSAEGEPHYFFVDSRQTDHVGDLQATLQAFVNELVAFRSACPPQWRVTGVLGAIVSASTDRVRLREVSSMTRLARQYDLFVLVRLP